MVGASLVRLKTAKALGNRKGRFLSKAIPIYQFKINLGASFSINLCLSFQFVLDLQPVNLFGSFSSQKKLFYKGVLIFLTDFTRPPLSADNCKRSAIIFNATLVNGYQSGKFVDHGDLGTIAACQDMCCQSPMCDVAFLVGKRCYSVYCHSESQCLWTPSKHNKYMLQLSYIHSAHRISNSGKSTLMPCAAYCTRESETL